MGFATFQDWVTVVYHMCMQLSSSLPSSLPLSSHLACLPLPPSPLHPPPSPPLFPLQMGPVLFGSAASSQVTEQPIILHQLKLYDDTTSKLHLLAHGLLSVLGSGFMMTSYPYHMGEGNCGLGMRLGSRPPQHMCCV